VQNIAAASIATKDIMRFMCLCGFGYVSVVSVSFKVKY